MTAPISRIGGQRVVTRDAGSDGHGAVAKQLDVLPLALKDALPRNKKVDEVAKMYERQFLGEMFKAMRSTVSETDKPSMAQGIYNSQRDDQYIDAWSEQGGIGFSNIIYDQIMDRFFGGTAQGQALKKQGIIPLTNRDITRVSEVKDGVAQPIVPRLPEPKPTPMPTPIRPHRTVENTEPMPAPTPALTRDSRSAGERALAGEYFPPTATVRPSPQDDADAGATASLAPTTRTTPSQTAFQVEVRPSSTGAPAKIQAPWDATVVRSTKIDGARTAVTLEHGQGVRSTLVFDGVLSQIIQPGQKIPRGAAIGTLNADAKSFLWNLATQVGSVDSEKQTAGQD